MLYIADIVQCLQWVFSMIDTIPNGGAGEREQEAWVGEVGVNHGYSQWVSVSRSLG